MGRLPRLTPAGYRQITLGALVALAVIIVTGGAVRLTGSGLGCPTWPKCEDTSLVPTGETGFHGTVEFVNRTFTGLVSAAVALAVLGSLRRVPRRRDLTWLSVGLVVGVVAQAVLGGITVKVGLSPPFVMAHFLLSLVLVATAVLLHHRAGQPEGPTVPLVAPEVRAMGRALLAAATLVVVTGTMVTGAGPHGGDADVERLAIDVRDIARIHGLAENLFLAAALLTLWLCARTGAPRRVRRDGQVLLAVLVAQAVVGYAQYFLGVPELLVGVHLVGATAVWIAVVRFHLRLWTAPEPDVGSRSG